MAQLVFALGTFVMIGFVWFFVARPALEGLGLIVNSSEDSSPVVMSRSEYESDRLSASDLRQTALQTPDQTAQPTYNRAGMLDIYRLMRKYNIPREEARAALRSAALPLDNNGWAAVAPGEQTVYTPIAGRPTKASYYPEDPELEYQAPAA